MGLYYPEMMRHSLGSPISRSLHAVETANENLFPSSFHPFLQRTGHLLVGKRGLSRFVCLEV